MQVCLAHWAEDFFGPLCRIDRGLLRVSERIEKYSRRGYILIGLAPMAVIVSGERMRRIENIWFRYNGGRNRNDDEETDAPYS